MTKETGLARKLLEWYDQNKRVLVFRGTSDPYKIWLSEIMLQQTRTETVEPYYLRFLDRFPTIKSLAEAEEEDVLRLWAGLGYYSRARNLHKAALKIENEFNGVFPQSAAELKKLPGIGDYTAAAIASIAFREPVPAMDGNLNRVFARLYDFQENTDAPHAKKILQTYAQDQISPLRPGVFNQAVMDLGATVCIPGTPRCENCPLQEDCLACRRGTADFLPVKSAKKAQKVIALNVYVMTYGNKLLITQRENALLKGLWTLPMMEKEKGFSKEFAFLKKSDAVFLRHARHVFTHLIWEMDIYHIDCKSFPTLQNSRAVTLEELRRLPLPAAHKAGFEEAEKILFSHP